MRNQPRWCHDPVLAFALALAELRSCLAALADTAWSFDESVHYEHLLLDLDRLYPDGSALYPTTGAKAELLNRLGVAIDQLIELGAAAFTLEPVIIDVRQSSVSSRSGPLRRASQIP